MKSKHKLKYLKKKRLGKYLYKILSFSFIFVFSLSLAGFAFEQNGVVQREVEAASGGTCSPIDFNFYAGLFNSNSDFAQCWQFKEVATGGIGSPARKFFCCCTPEEFEGGLTINQNSGTCPCGFTCQIDSRPLDINFFPVVDPATGGIQNPNAAGNPTKNLGETISSWYSVGFFIALLLAVIMVIYGGVEYATAAGNADKVQNAKAIILEALIGLGVALIAGGLLVFLRGSTIFNFT